AHHAAVPRLDDDQARFRCGDGGELGDRGRGAVVVDANVVEQGRRRPAGANRSQLVIESVFRVAHALFAAPQDVRDAILQHRSASQTGPATIYRVAYPKVSRAGADAGQATSVPMGSPSMARRMLPSWARSNTMIGSLLSMHSEIAVLSMTLS